MNIKITDEQVFAIPTDSFAVGFSATGYTLNYSVDGTNFTEYTEETPANEVCVVKGGAKGLYFKLDGNEGQVEIIY